MHHLHRLQGGYSLNIFVYHIAYVPLYISTCKQFLLPAFSAMPVQLMSPSPQMENLWPLWQQTER